MKLLNVLSVGLFLALPSLRAQWYAEETQYYDNNTTVDVWIDVSPADGTWAAGGDTFFPGIYGCELCSTDATISVEIDVDGSYFTSNSYTDPNGSASTEYVANDSSTGAPVELSAYYQVYGSHSWGAGGARTYCSVAIPGVPTSIYLNSVDTATPGFAYFNYRTVPNGVQSLYSSTLIIGGQYSISQSTENPVFLFDETQLPGVDFASITTPIEFQGYLAGHYFYGPTYYLTVSLGQNVTDFKTTTEFEGTEIAGVITSLASTHTAREVFDFFTYPPGTMITSEPDYVIHYRFANANIDNTANFCTPTGPVECDIALIAEVNRWPFPPYPATYNDPMNHVPFVGIAPPGRDDFVWAMEV